jgi:uncharacterized protein YraI
MRTGPGQRHAVIAAIPADACDVMKVGRCVQPDDGISSYEWCFVRWNGNTGWVSAGGLVYDHDGSMR